MSKLIYLDNAATTELDREVLDVMLPWLEGGYGNPSSIYSIGREAKKAIEESRQKVANAINARSNEIYFTGSGSEADNWAIKGIVNANAEKGKHLITTNIEHHAVLHVFEYLEKKGYEVTYVPVEENGIVDPAGIKEALREDTILVSVMTANNEIGTIQPINEIGKLLSDHQAFFHTDAVQAIGNIPVDVKVSGADLLSMSAHKFHGPKGIGALYIRRGVKIDNLLHGGGQERTRRASTENTAGIVGMGFAIEKAVLNMDITAGAMKNARDHLIDRILNEIPYTILNGDREKRLPGNANFSFRFIEGEGLLLFLDMKGIMASSGSACTSGSLDPSHVLLALGLPHEIAHGSLRLSVGNDADSIDTDYVIDSLKEIVAKLRDMSPLYEEFEKSKSAED